MPAPELAVASAVGRARLTVVRRPVVAVLASGDELVPVEEFDEVRAGRRIVSTNSYALAAQLAAVLDTYTIVGAYDAARNQSEWRQKFSAAAEWLDYVTELLEVYGDDH